MNEKQKVYVEIAGKPYPIESKLTPLELDSLAKKVNEKLKEASSTSKNPSTSEVAILSCLNIADELFTLQQKYDNLNYFINKESDEMISMINSALKDKKT